MIEQRQYQEDAIKKIFDAWNPQTQNLTKVLLQMPTGTGKTTVFSKIVAIAQKSKKKVLLVVHRKELVEQIHNRLKDCNVEAGIISASFKSNETKPIQVASIQTLSKRYYPPADIIIIDECHHSKAESYKKLWEIYPEARFLGVTATPVRLNGEGFSDLFETLISVGKLSYFFENGYLAKLKQYVCSIPDLSAVKKKMKDYDLQMLGHVMMSNNLMADLITSYKKIADGKKTIVFAVNIEHSKEIVKRYLDNGIPAEHLDAKTPDNERKEILQRFKSGETLVLSNVDIVSEGFDVPDCEAVQLARPTKSLVLYLQQVGRCMRPFQGKENGLVLDNAGLWLEHGLSFIDREWSLEGDKKTSKLDYHPRYQIAIDEEEIIREIKKPEEALGLELTPITEELERLLIFESFLTISSNKNYQLISAFFRFMS